MPNAVLSKRKRITYLTICVVLFFILAPLVAYYATGYRVGESFKIAKTGGIYIVIEGKGFSILLNGKEQEVSSIFRRNFFIQDLAPARYSLKVSKDGFQSWEKSIDVLSEKVADVYPFNLPKDIELVEVTKTIVENTDEESGASSTVKVKTVENEEYQKVRDLFATSSPRLISQKLNASSTKDEPRQFILHKKIALWAIEDEIFVKWEGEEDNAPLYFCNQVTCLNKMSVFRGFKINNVDVLSDKQAYIIFSVENGIYVTEIDGRGGRNIQALILGEGYDFRLDKDEVLYIKKGKSYYRADFTL